MYDCMLLIRMLTVGFIFLSLGFIILGHDRYVADFTICENILKIYNITSNCKMINNYHYPDCYSDLILNITKYQNKMYICL